ncbi:uncharacterized protein LOC115453339 [Manduca sexta]|uniref:uncharacterized protein LOC115453339 n=1 Tax=Manduca sexta TaxID=7130 RepID=UPI001184450B|nr:uncharacterized protein LOC115453339 [Manduca sexta]KAG6438511.1 hypothetical protein O3G_MSEX000024 [Manduca sexta]
MYIFMKSMILLCVILCALPCVYSIKCWNCRSNNDPKCADPFDNSTVPITDCKQEKGLSHLPDVRPSMCRKIRQKVNGEWRYFRDCAYLGEVGIQGDERFCLMRTGTYNIFVEYCTCNSKDGCNSSSMLSPVSLLFTLLSSFSLMKLVL